MFHNFAFGMGGWGMLMMVVFWIGLFTAVIWLVRSLVASGQSHSGVPTGREIADQRYTRGEITREEYLVIKEDLGH